MNDLKCPFCNEPRTRSSVTGNTYRCGTHGPDINGEYNTGRICDMHMYQRLLKNKDDEITTLKQKIAEAKKEMESLYGQY